MVEARRSIAGDRNSVVQIWVEAFAADPVIRWFLPDEGTYVEKAALLFGFIFDVRHAGGEIWVAPQRAAAAWTPPGGLAPMDPSPQQLWGEVAALLDEDLVRRMDDYEAELKRLLPEFDTWYLGVVGTMPGSQGLGFGSAVVRPVLARADAAGVPQSLETCVPQNRALYEKWGFEVTGEFSVGDGPEVWVMVRQPGAGS